MYMLSQEELGEGHAFGDVAAAIGARWKEMDDEDKAPYTKVGACVGERKCVWLVCVTLCGW